MSKVMASLPIFISRYRKSVFVIGSSSSSL
jgi:hypothetical protein